MKGGGVGGSSTETYSIHILPPSARLCTAAVRCPRKRDAQRHQYVGAWEGVAPVCRCAVIDATKIIEDYRRFSASFWPGIFRISAKNLPLLSLRPSLTVGMTKIPKIPGLFYYFFAGIPGIFPQNPAPKRLRPALPRVSLSFCR